MKHALVLTLAAALGLTACSPGADKAETKTTAVSAPASPDVHRFRAGGLELVALREGGMTVPNDNKILAVGETPEAVSQLLTANGLPGDSLSLSIQPLLVRNGQQLVLIDAGAGQTMGPNAGKLPASLKAAGVEPAQINDIVISHGHGDHVGGLVTGGALTFPNATIHISAAEWTALKGDQQMAELVRVITPKVKTFQPGAELFPGIRPVALQGHTPGHMGVEIGTGEDQLLYIADMAHHQVVSVQRPEWTIAFDGDEQTAEATRRAVFTRAAEQNQRIYAVHFPFPGIGRIEKQGETLAWVPER